MMITSKTPQLASGLRTVVTRLVKKLRSKSSVSEKLSMTERSVIKLLDEHKELLPSELVEVIVRIPGMPLMFFSNGSVIWLATRSGLAPV